MPLYRNVFVLLEILILLILNFSVPVGALPQFQSQSLSPNQVLTINKRQPTYSCNTVDRIAEPSMSRELKLGAMPWICLVFTVWKFGRSEERRRLHGILRSWVTKSELKLREAAAADER